MENKLRILVANDDGIDAPGLKALVKRLSIDHEVYVCAPDGERSSMSHAVTYWRLDNEAQKRNVEGAKEAWAVHGTPADCVFYGLSLFWKGKIDLVVSGINQGENLNADAAYSGTIGAAMEGLMLGVPSMAVSLCSFTAKDFEPAAIAAAKLLNAYMQDENRLSYVCSINVPAVSCEQIKGVRVTQFDHFKTYTNKSIDMIHQDGRILLHCQQDPPAYPREPKADGDRYAVEQGYISVTPIGKDAVHHDILAHMYSWNDFSL
ncbi:MAG: 5'/3'-nucleotidase SurE [Lactimicrobium sp.]|uniref:5'/3'-nucleotidase SurE n=1 Tax=Lactimicrobium sp. TaxID=2563780 RepID=UPI002F352D2B